MSACLPVPNPRISRFGRGYNSHGNWSDLEEIRTVEVERGNEFPDLPGCPGNTPAIWVTKTPRGALRYSVDASEWDRVDSGGSLTDWEREEVRAIASRPIQILPTDVLAVDDGDGGYLVLRPIGDPPDRSERAWVEENNRQDAIPTAGMSGCITTGRRAGYCRPDAIEKDFGGAQNLLDEFLFFAVGIDGIIVNRETASDPNLPCRCVDITKANGTKEPFCFKKGVVGTLSQAQVGEICKTRFPLNHPEGIRRRIETFQAAAESCKGLPIETRLECMSRDLKTRGVKWGLGKD